MLYNGHLEIAETFFRNRPNHSETLIEKPPYNGKFYSGHFVIADTFLEYCANILDKIYLLIADTL